MSRKNSNREARRYKYGKPSANYYEVAEKGLKAPANDNGGMISPKYKNILKVLVPLLLCLAFLAWF